MELIKKLGTRIINGYRVSLGIFLCPFCLQEVEKQLSGRKKCKSCGCIKNKLISNTLIGRKQTKETIEKRNQKLKGKKRTEEQIRRYSEAKIGDKNPNFGKIFSEETRQKVSIGNKGKKRTEEHKLKYSKSKLGDKNPMYGRFGDEHPNWNGGTSFGQYPIEFNDNLKQQILERDNYTCQNSICEKLSNRLEIHHIDFDKKNNLQENLITLCYSCHGKTKGINSRNNFIGYYQNIMRIKCNLELL